MSADETAEATGSSAEAGGNAVLLNQPIAILLMFDNFARYARFLWLNHLAAFLLYFILFYFIIN